MQNNLLKKLCFLTLVTLAGLSSTFAKERNLPGITIITRKERGADESRRYNTLPYKQRKQAIANRSQAELDRLEESNLDEFFDKQKTTYIKDMRNEYLLSAFASEQTIDETRYESLGHYLKRPESIHNEKTKIIVHHTAGSTITFSGKQDVMKYLSDIYKYHTYTKGRGDIGYQFLIDPYGNIYEGRAGGEGVIGAQTSRNNVSSVGISLMGNFDVQSVPTPQKEALIALATALAKKYHIDVETTVSYNKEISDAPYLKTVQGFALAGHRDAGITSCPGKNLYALLPTIRQQVEDNVKKGTLINFTPSTPTVTVPVKTTNTTTNTTPTPIKTTTGSSSSTVMSGSLSMLRDRKPAYTNVVNDLKEIYFSGKADTRISSPTTTKISYKISQKEVTALMKKPVSVLLYDVSTQLKNRDLSCDGGCTISLDGKTYSAKKIKVSLGKTDLTILLDAKKYTGKAIAISSASSANTSLVQIINYTRASYAKVPRNTFHGTLLIQKDKIKNAKTSKFDTQYVVINKLDFSDYLNGIAETSEAEHSEKLKVMALLVKTYTLFYLNGKNVHPSIPAGAAYQAIDHPDFFQKYVGAGTEKVLKKRQQALNATKNQILLFEGNVPILPYFSCSVGFTRSAQEKRGRKDTPYLQGRIDPVSCTAFAGHGVGLSGKGAQFFAQQGRTMKQILDYYYPGVEVTNL